MSANPAASSNPKKILVRGVNWLGDAVMCAPALLRLREARPDDLITLITEEKIAELWSGHPAIDRIISFSNTESIFELAGRLRAECFDIALVLPNSFRSAAECFLARIPRRIGYARNGRGPLLTERIAPRGNEFRMRKRSAREVHRLVHSTTVRASSEIPPDAHQMHHYLRLVRALGASSDPQRPQIAIGLSEVEIVLAKFQLEPYRQLRLPLFGLNPGAEYGPAKRWPIERFIAAAAEVQRVQDCCWLIFGGAADIDLATRITAGITSAAAPPAKHNLSRIINLAGRTTLRELCACMSLCDVVLTNDTGPMHLAAAVGTPVVATFGSTSPEVTGPGIPGNQRHRIVRTPVPCAPCFRRCCPIDLRCLNGIHSQEVVTAVLEAALTAKNGSG